jgi:glycosyltransferase involved in cell wall biosynthesis
MRICFICVEIFAWGKYGGFGRSTRLIGRELAKKGIRVFAIVPRRENQKKVEDLDGIRVLSFPMTSPFASRELFQECNADIYHSQHPSFATYWAMKSMPRKKHMITFRDPKSIYDWFIEFRYPSISRLRTIFAYLNENNFLVMQAVKKADGLFCCAHYLDSKVRDLYKLKSALPFLPSPVLVPDRPMQKSSHPTVCFLARWDRRKRPELFFEMAKRFPHVRFIAAGKSQDSKWDEFLRKKYRNIPNLELTGFIDQFATDKLSGLLEKSWILVNTATREGLPTSFLEALAHRCAILSRVNPDGIAERFGYHVRDDDFTQGLEWLLENDTWRKMGENGWLYVKENYELGKVIDKHISVYSELLNK